MLSIKKKKLRLSEDDEKNAYVEPSDEESNNLSDIGNDIEKTRQNNPTDNTFTVPLSNYDGNSNNNPVSIDVDAKNGQEAQSKITSLINGNPSMKTMASNGKLVANVKMEENRKKVKSLRENASFFTKKEIHNYLKK